MSLSLIADFSLKEKQNQNQVMTLAMQQSLFVLQLPIIELCDYVTQEVSDNALLEFSERGPDTTKNQEEEKVRRYKETLITENRSLFAHLMAQAHDTFSTQEELKIAEEIIGNLDDRGFFPTLPQTPKEQAILQEIQTFEPRGIGAKNLQESLLLQLKQKHSLAFILISKHFDLLLKNKRSLLQKRLKCSAKELQESIHVISRLNLNPASSFEHAFNPSIVVDLILEHDGEKWSIHLNDQYIPSFHLAKNNSLEETVVRHYLTQAKWLISALRKREITLKRIARVLIKHNEPFLLGKSRLTASLTMQKVATSLNLHESTITRAIADKYLLSPAGMFPLRSFFKRGGNSAAILLKQLITKENKKRPLSDEAIAQKLRAQGFTIARRTVSKYRKELRIASASKRRHHL